jgi:hypothetical protein
MEEPGKHCTSSARSACSKWEAVKCDRTRQEKRCVLHVSFKVRVSFLL